VELGLQVLQELAIVVAEQAVQVSWSLERHQRQELLLEVVQVVQLELQEHLEAM
jgi:hypothetical protein